MSRPLPANRVNLISVAKEAIWRKNLPNEVTIEMEDPRLKIATMRMEDSRCNSLNGDAVAEMDDPRCKSLLMGGASEMEDALCRIAASEMEDPRCQRLRSW